MAFVEIPLSAKPQRFRITLAGVEYVMTMRWCDYAPAWMLDIADRAEQPLAAGIAVVAGVDLVGQFSHRGFGFELWTYTDHNVDASPTFENLGVTSHLVAVVP